MASNIRELREGVSIIGVGCTPFGNLLTTPGIKDFTERELFSWAALEAMEDAGIEAKDIDAFYMGQTMPETLSHMHSCAAQVADWIGMRNKPGVHFESACSSSNTGLGLAALAVASGRYRIVLSGGVETTNSRPRAGKPSHMREPIPEGELSMQTRTSSDQAYWYPSGLASAAQSDLRAVAYGKKYGLTLEQLEDAVDGVIINNRRNGVRNPLATTYTEEYPEEARGHGFKNVKDYLRSRFNPKIASISRAFHAAFPVDGASALIVCPTKMARAINDHPIDVIGFGTAVNIGYHLVEADSEIEKSAFAQAYEMTKIDPAKDIDYMSTHDCYALHQFMSAEVAGYLRPGEGWRAAMEGRTAFDGDKPINTTGGRTTMGHAYSASAGAEIAEAVRQMRGLCGARQIKNRPEVSVIQNTGGGRQTSVCVLRAHS